MGNIETFELYRESYSDKNTIGTLLRNHTFYGHTLEDPVRPDGVKLYGKTAILAEVYILEVRWSEKYQEERVFVLNVKNFTGIQMHGGNDEDDTEGCILCALNVNMKTRRIWGSLKDDLIRIVKASKRSYLHIYNLNQK